MIENNRIIAEADEALEHSLMMPNSIISVAQHRPDSGVKGIERDVDKFIARLPSNYPQLHELEYNLTPEPVQAQPDTIIFINKYNYTGRSYRFEEA